jgi:rhodanese-related sulfurtransferase
MKKIALILLVLLPAFVKADFKTLSTEQVQDKIKQELVIIDVRRQDEYQQYGIIPNAHKLTMILVRLACAQTNTKGVSLLDTIFDKSRNHRSILYLPFLSKSARTDC